MSEPDLERADLERLLGAVRDDALAPHEMAELDQLLRTSPRARAYYLEHADLCAALADYVGSPAAPLAPDRLPARWSVRWRRVRYAAAAAALLAIGVTGYFGWPDRGVSAGAVGTLTRSVAAVWAGPTPAVGGSLPPLTLRLTSGVAQIDLAGGATVVLDGPAEFDLTAADRGFLRAGKLRAVLRAGGRGLTVGTPACEVIDRGTEFGLAVDAAGRTEVHVFDGRVEVRGPVPPLELAAGRAARVGPNEPARDIPPRAAAFVGPRDLDRWPTAAARAAPPGWAARSARLRADPRVLAYLPFDGPAGGRVVRNRAAGDDPGWDGILSGAKWADGRWAGRPAVEFRAAGDQIRVESSHDLRAFTLAAWVRVDDLDRAYHALLLTDGWEQGSLHWQIDARGRLVLGARGSFTHVSPPVVGREHLGRWLFLAATCDPRAGGTTHYLNGSPVSSAPRKDDAPVRVGPAAVGDWANPLAGDPNPVRTLRGRVDELLIVREALTEDDVLDLYTHGRPDP